jgi:hypothetical protein
MFDDKQEYLEMTALWQIDVAQSVFFAQAEHRTVDMHI